jgi:hypothetical protein
MLEKVITQSRAVRDVTRPFMVKERPRLAHVLDVDAVVPLEDRRGPMATDLHDHVLVDPGVDQVP